MAKSKIALSLANVNSLPTTAGVYFVYSDSELIYIGQTTNFRTRFAQHLYSNRFGILVITVKLLPISTKARRLDTEHELILKHSPRLNLKIGTRNRPHRFAIFDTTAYAYVLADPDLSRMRENDCDTDTCIVYAIAAPYTHNRHVWCASPILPNGAINLTSDVDEAYRTRSLYEWHSLKYYLRHISGSHGAHEMRVGIGCWANGKEVLS